MRVHEVLSLPAETTPFERKYLARLNRVALGVLAVHLPVLTAFAWWNDTGPVLAFELCAFALTGPLLAHGVLKERPRVVSCVIGVALMLMSAVLVHVGQGPMQIEMHFHFFVTLASLAVFGNPRVIQLATASVTLHHVLCWWLFPVSVFNYDAAVMVVAVHAVFVGLLALSTSFIARHFFDNVIELTRKVEAKTRDLAARHRDVRLLLDHIGQGFLTLEGDGSLGPVRSHVLERWFGARITTATRWCDFLRSVDADFAARTELGWEAVVDDFMPVEVTLQQMPGRVAVADRCYAFHYRHISGSGTSVKVLVVVDDVTDAVAAEAASRTLDGEAQLLQGILRDPAEALRFVEDGEELVGRLQSGAIADLEVKRSLHTLKGNAGIAGFHVVARAAHDLEQHLVDTGTIGMAEVEALAEPLRRMSARFRQLRGAALRSIPVDPERLAALERAIEGGAPAGTVAARVRDLRCEPVRPRLLRLADHATRIAHTLGKSDAQTHVDDRGIRLDPSRWAGVWSALVHVVRNAVDHGLESTDERVRAGKPAAGRLWFRAHECDGVVTIEIEDDGRGLDLAALARKAVAAGLPADSTEQILEALWVDGVSTAPEVTETSGRGVGMAALRAAVEAAGGTVRVSTRSGAGTTFHVVVVDATATTPATRVSSSRMPAPLRGSWRPNGSGARGSA